MLFTIATTAQITGVDANMVTPYILPRLPPSTPNLSACVTRMSPAKRKHLQMRCFFVLSSYCLLSARARLELRETDGRLLFLGQAHVHIPVQVSPSLSPRCCWTWASSCDPVISLSPPPTTPNAPTDPVSELLTWLCR